MKKLSKVLVLVLSVMMVFGMSIVSFAAGETYDGTITVAKNYKGQTYTLYKIFDATTVEGRTSDATDGISYKLMSGKTDLKATVGGATVDGAQWFKVDSAGNVSLADGVTSITFNDDFRKWVEAYGAQTGNALTASANDDATIKWTGLTGGYYFITTTTGSLVTVDSIEPDVTINDKNSIPGVDKTITGASDITDEGKKALAQIGTDVTYTAEITVGAGSKNLVFHDTMDTGLTFKGNNNVTVATDDTTVTGTWYTIKETPDTGDTLTITFRDGLKEGSKITITYKATVNASAVTVLKNHATVSYGDNNTKTEESFTETYNASIGVMKYDGAKANNKPLPNAGFVLKNSEGKYYKLAADGKSISWVTLADNKDATIKAAITAGTITENTSGTDGKVPAFIGLANGTYTLVESTVPAGYNKAADTDVTIASGNYTTANLNQVAEIENNTGTELPGTGGIGTTIFYVLGSLLVIGCGIVLVSRRRMQNNK